jgi:DNA-directed RNA polymerase subunit RPC12/RpoP
MRHMSKKVLPPYIYCPRCGSKIIIEEDVKTETIEKIKEQGYTAIGRGVCECGVVVVLCYQPLPASPTFSLFFDIYEAEVVKRFLESKKKEKLISSL